MLHKKLVSSPVSTRVAVTCKVIVARCAGRWCRLNHYFINWCNQTSDAVRLLLFIVVVLKSSLLVENGGLVGFLQVDLAGNPNASLPTLPDSSILEQEVCIFLGVSHFKIVKAYKLFLAALSVQCANAPEKIWNL